MKRLLLCRHAQSDWKDAAMADIERPLTKLGELDASLMGKRLAARGMQPDLIVSSPARRALSTADRLARELVGYAGKKIAVVEGLYGVSPEGLLAIVGKLESGSTVCLVGHNPETTIFANYLGGLSLANMPTCGIVALEFDVGAWGEISGGAGTLLFFDYPRKEDCG